MTTPTYLGAEQDMIDLWVEARIRAGAAVLTDPAYVGLPDRVFNAFAPEGTPYPFIIYQTQVPPRDVRGVGVTRVLVDTLYVVKAVAQVTSFHPLRDVARVIDGAMTQPDAIAVTGGFINSSVREDQFSLVEIEAGKQYRHLGGIFRIHAQAV